ncbi:MAG TPA: adenosylcobinamide-GDP ribazoletransferase [Solirubrobacteraceae bacterium]|nr:adenosylcobinamide-GDP ribazoletransferase [Solirubrobacteraceae bacterium]
MAVGFLTVVPVGLRGEARPPGAAAGWFPVVGGVLGGVAGGVYYGLEPSVGRTVAAILGVGVLVAVTGGLHQDGLADWCDGLGGRGDRDRRLAIMRDSAIGTFGAVGLIVWLMLFVSGLAGLDRADGLRAVVVACAAGRWAALVHAETAGPARTDGLGAGFVVERGAFVVASGLAGVICVVGGGVVGGLVGLGVAGAVGLVISAWSRRGLGGRTGDTLGACVAIGEVAVVVCMLGVGVG